MLFVQSKDANAVTAAPETTVCTLVAVVFASGRGGAGMPVEVTAESTITTASSPVPLAPAAAGQPVPRRQWLNTLGERGLDGH